MYKIRRYLIFTFVFAWTIGIIGAHDHNIGSAGGELSFSLSLAFCMFMPTLGAFLCGADIPGMGWRPRFRQNIRLYLFAWLAPTFFQLAGAALYFLIFREDFDLTGEYLAIFRPAVYADLVRSGKSYTGYAAKEIIAPLFSIYFPTSVIMGLGEEIGWRGFLFPELDGRFGRTKAVLLGGVIHGAWHFPVMLLAGYEYGKDYIGAPLLGLFAFCVFTVTTGIISYHLYEKSTSIWLPALYHAAVNSVFNPYILGAYKHAERMVFGPLDIGLIGVIPALIFAVFLLRSDNKRELEALELFPEQQAES